VKASRQHIGGVRQFTVRRGMMANIAVSELAVFIQDGNERVPLVEGIGNYMEVRKLALSGIENPTIGPDSPIVLSLKVLYSYPGYSTEEQGNRDAQK